MDGIHASLRRRRAWKAMIGLHVFPRPMRESADGCIQRLLTRLRHVTLSPLSSIHTLSLGAASVLPPG